eukprot:6361999-Alexandrium_andersonii.AAC.1
MADVEMAAFVASPSPASPDGPSALPAHAPEVEPDVLRQGTDGSAVSSPVGGPEQSPEQLAPSTKGSQASMPPSPGPRVDRAGAL